MTRRKAILVLPFSKFDFPMTSRDKTTKCTSSFMGIAWIGAAMPVMTEDIIETFE